MSFWSKLFGSDVDDSGANSPSHEWANEERPAADPQEAALDSLRQHGWNAADWVEALGNGSDGKGWDWADRAINASNKYHEENNP